MQLNPIQYTRTFALIEGLRLMSEKANERRQIHPLDDLTKIQSPDGKLVTRQSLAIKGLQNFVEGRATQYAEQFDVSFPDETERETVETLAAWRNQFTI
jgi:hypothetical protein